MDLIFISSIMDKIKMDVVDIILSRYPELKRDRTNIINEVLGRREKQNENVLDRFIYDGNVLYRDHKGNVLNGDIEFKGCYIRKGQTIVYYIEQNNYNDSNLDADIKRLFDVINEMKKNIKKKPIQCHY